MSISKAQLLPFIELRFFFFNLHTFYIFHVFSKNSFAATIYPASTISKLHCKSCNHACILLPNLNYVTDPTYLVITLFLTHFRISLPSLPTPGQKRTHSFPLILIPFQQFFIPRPLSILCAGCKIGWTESIDGSSDETYCRQYERKTHSGYNVSLYVDNLCNQSQYWTREWSRWL